MSDTASKLGLKRAYIQIKKGKWALAIEAIKAVLSTNPHYYEAWLLLSRCLFENDEFQQAIDINRKAEAFDPLLRSFQQIQGFMQQNRFAEAQGIANTMLKKQPGHPRAIFTLAHIAMMKQHFQEALNALNIGIQRSPANLMLLKMRISCIESCGLYEKALIRSAAYSQLDSSDEALLIYLSMLLRYAKYDELVAQAESKLSQGKIDDKTRSTIFLLNGQAQRIMGHRKSALADMQKSLSLNNKNTATWWALADFKDLQFSNVELTRLNALVTNKSLSKSDKGIACFALGKAYEQAEDWESATTHYQTANDLLCASNFQILQLEQEMEHRTKLYSKDVLGIQASTDGDECTNGEKSTPIFIVGLPRSGSTLLEQMLASHSQIEATIEQPTMPVIERLANELCMNKYQKGLFQALEALTQEDLTNLGRAYTAKSAYFRRTTKAYFIDKLPFNFRHIGLIHKILPHAVIIDIRRNPLDCGVSLYKQYFPSGLDFCYRLDYIAATYNAYQSLMDYWHQVLPNKALHVQYETLVQSPYEQISRALSHINLDFEATCLDFHLTKRNIHTASSEQVRVAINKKGIGYWQNFPQFSEHLLEFIGPETAERYKPFSR